jgi:CheY-like chemotaxis protein
VESKEAPRPVLSALVADDDSYMLDLVASFLRKEGFVVMVASSGTELLGVLADGLEPNLIVTDVQMPGLSGLAVLAHVKQHHSPVPVILMTAFATDSLRESARKSGAAAVLAKPFTTLELHDMVARYVRRD